MCWWEVLISEGVAQVCSKNEKWMRAEVVGLARTKGWELSAGTEG